MTDYYRKWDVKSFILFNTLLRIVLKFNYFTLFKPGTMYLEVRYIIQGVREKKCVSKLAKQPEGISKM